jgi:hypothetical protein
MAGEVRAYGFGRDYTKGYGHETHFEKIEKLGKFLVEKLNHSVQDVRLGLDRIAEIYTIDVVSDHEPICTNMDRMLAKALFLRKKMKAVEALLTNTKDPPEAKLASKDIPTESDVDKIVNAWLERMDQTASVIEDSVHTMNEKCQMNLRLEERMEEPFLDIKQFIQAVIRKWNRTAFGWQMVQIMIITNNIDIERASPALLEDAQALKMMYDNEFVTAEEYAERRLQILDKMFMRQKDTDREDRIRWEVQQYNLKDLYGEKKATLPDHYDRQVAKDFDFYNQEKDDDEEVRRIRKLALVEREAAQKINRPVLLNNDTAHAVEQQRFQKYGAAVVEKNTAAAPSYQARVETRAPPKQAVQLVAPVAVANDLELRKQRYAEEQAAAQEGARRRQQEREQEATIRPAAKSKPEPSAMPTSANDVEKFKRAMIEKYEAQQRENSEILRKKREAAGQA